MSLPNEPTFATKDPETVKAEILERYTEETGVSLAPADPRRLHMMVWWLLLAQLRTNINNAGLQNLLAFVDDEHIDAIGELLNMDRKAATAATTTIRFTVDLGGGAAEVIPAGTEITDGNLLWATDEDLTVDENGYHYVGATCETTGTAGNGYAIGQLTTLVEPLWYVFAVTNTTETAGGTDSEDLEAYRSRLRDAAHGFAVAGPRDAYRVIAQTANANIQDVAVVNFQDSADGKITIPPEPDPGDVHVYVLQKRTDPEDPIPTGGEPITDVETALDADTVRPLTDNVDVYDPVENTFSVTVSYWIAQSDAGQAAEIQTAVEAAVVDYIDWQVTAFGRDVNPSVLIEKMMAAGAKRVTVSDPAAFVVVKKNAACELTSKTITYEGLEDD
jgi:phage-related baseplate assembly protein